LLEGLHWGRGSAIEGKERTSTKGKGRDKEAPGYPQKARGGWSQAFRKWTETNHWGLSWCWRFLKVPCNLMTLYLSAWVTYWYTCYMYIKVARNIMLHYYIMYHFYFPLCILLYFLFMCKFKLYYYYISISVYLYEYQQSFALHPLISTLFIIYFHIYLVNQPWPQLVNQPWPPQLGLGKII
jgi:hypothetical protein